ncbi:hypothetical protein KIN20_007041 [Parelaphostrongylus tenuis]|uniref:Uncharacterized protein n=1 Tax=Parelaphostrongylus tenuis TaxID=148309 RepID=A0AAD5MNI1_PARTN|nr:hypothetical protein KIN20_007041 [Parelaphostrongylus tenuis]
MDDDSVKKPRMEKVLNYIQLAYTDRPSNHACNGNKKWICWSGCGKPHHPDHYPHTPPTEGPTTEVPPPPSPPGRPFEDFLPSRPRPRPERSQRREERNVLENEDIGVEVGRRRRETKLHLNACLQSDGVDCDKTTFMEAVHNLTHFLREANNGMSCDKAIKIMVEAVKIRSHAIISKSKAPSSQSRLVEAFFLHNCCDAINSFPCFILYVCSFFYEEKLLITRVLQANLRLFSFETRTISSLENHRYKIVYVS